MRWSWLLLLCLLVTACRTPLPVPGMRIEGNRQVDTDDLVESAERHLEAFRKNDGRLADADDAAYAMEVFMRGEGYPDARVRFEAEGRRLVFRVTEGPKPTFGKVRFEGVKSIPETELAKLFEFEGSGFLGLGATRLDPAKVASAVSGVEALYLERGHRAVDVEEPRLNWSADKRTVDVVVRVEEGPQFTVSGVDLHGVARSYIDGEDVVGKPFKQGLPFQMAGRLRRRMRDEGYAFAAVSGTPELDESTATGRVVLKAERGELVRLRKLDIKGDDQTRESFIRKRFKLRPGEVIKRTQFERGIAELYRSSLFSRVDTQVEPIGTNQADLTIEVKEAKTKRLDVEVGWGAWEMLRGRVEYKDFNILGRGRILRASALASMKSYGGELEFEDPWILGRDTRVWWNVNALYREERFYDYYGAGTELGVEHRFDRQSKAWAGYRFRLEEGRNIDADIPPETREEIQGLQRSAGVFVRGRYDDRDDRFLPSKGWIVEGNAFWSTEPLGASLNYLELELRATYHVDLGRWGVLAVGGFAATRQPFGGTVLPLQQRYFLGGQQSVRSYNQDELTPVTPSGQGIGGLSAYEGHVEWRQKIYDVIHGALFYDVGIVSQDSFSLEGIVGHGIGGGLRLYTPVGPVRFDLGYNPGNLYGASNRLQFFFSFGFSF